MAVEAFTRSGTWNFYLLVALLGTLHQQVGRNEFELLSNDIHRLLSLFSYFRTYYTKFDKSTNELVLNILVTNRIKPIDISTHLCTCFTFYSNFPLRRIFHNLDCYHFRSVSCTMTHHHTFSMSNFNSLQPIR